MTGKNEKESIPPHIDPVEQAMEILPKRDPRGRKRMSERRDPKPDTPRD